MKVIHVVESLDQGAVESWLVRMLGHARQRGTVLDWTFYCTLNAPGALEGKAIELGARILRSPAPLGRQAAFVSELRNALREGSYDVLHCHHDLVSGLYLLAATGVPIRRRLVHVHNAYESVLTDVPLKQWIYRLVLRRICLSMADRVIGISHHTLQTFLAGRPPRPGRDIVHYCGVDPARFVGALPDRVEFRRAQNLAEDSLILLFGSRLVPEKNPIFTVDVLAALQRHEPRAVAVFAGAGSLGEKVLARARALGVERAVRMLGWRSDLPDIMRCSDWFILPAPELPPEGFGLVVVEAQLAGLRLLVSRGLRDDPFFPTAKFRRLPLSASPAKWAAAAIELLHGPPPSAQAAWLELEHSPLNMDRALDGLLTLHS